MRDMVGGEGAHQSERTSAPRPIESAKPGQMWIGGRHFCTRPILEGFAEAGACFIVREHTNRPRATLRAFAVSVLADDVPALIARGVERAHEPAPKVSFFHRVVQIRSGYEGLTIALPPGHWSTPNFDTSGLVDRPLQPAQRIRTKSIAVGKRAPEVRKPRGGVAKQPHAPPSPQPAS